MSSFLQQLENNEAVLLMYLADELPAEDRAEVEQLLATDAAMRAHLDELRRATHVVDEAMRRDDAVTPLPVSEAVAVRQVARSFARWRAEIDARTPAPLPIRRGLRYPWWSYPLASAAAVLLGFLVWWGNGSGLPSSHQIPADAVVTRLIEDENVAYVQRSFEMFEDPEEILRLGNVESEFATLAAPSEDEFPLEL